jgi:hypothetical protein
MRRVVLCISVCADHPAQEGVPASLFQKTVDNTQPRIASPYPPSSDGGVGAKCDRKPSRWWTHRGRVTVMRGPAASMFLGSEVAWKPARKPAAPASKAIAAALANRGSERGVGRPGSVI